MNKFIRNTNVRCRIILNRKELSKLDFIILELSSFVYKTIDGLLLENGRGAAVFGSYMQRVSIQGQPATVIQESED